MYRAIDSNRNPIDVYLSKTRGRAAADAFFRSAVAVTVIILKMTTTHKYAG
ncbi:DDE-type integrase/transposase/recombinase [Azospirillum sp.]|uniref:DDE-type integrase/transposase/recombinase n=1 Tax=Azospirillum sp. TaxID=34012 RepID=UPI0039C89AFA